MNIFEKMFCKHKWKSHAKDRMTASNMLGYEKVFDREVLICQHCGKIKIIEY